MTGTRQENTERATAGPFAGAIFDMDGTLVHTEPFHQQSWIRALHDLGIEFDGADYTLRVSGRPGREISRDLFGFDPEQAEDMSSRVTSAFWEIAAGNVEPLPGVRAFLTRIAHIPKAVATSARRHSATRMLQELGLLDYFAAIVTADDISRGKPEPDIFLLAAERLEVVPARCMVFEDAVAGVVAAQAAGMYCAAITTTRDDFPNADLVFSAWDDPRLPALFPPAPERPR
ncbi:MAG: HAD family hydrolase [Thermomicrobiales bacterium]